MSHEHISTQFDAEMEGARTRMLRMGGLVEEQLTNALAGFANADVRLLESVQLKEDEVNGLEIELDDRCTHIIARRQPAASDLRMIMAVIKATTDLERVGDEAAKIARTAQQMHTRGMSLPGEFSGVRVAANIAGRMLKDSLDAFARLDVTAARAIVLRDRQMDDEFRRLLRELLTFMIEDPRTISTALDAIWIAKSLERVGDHAKNISQYVIFIAEGTDVRHARPNADNKSGAMDDVAGNS
jgi:phosphate transport system protein